MIPESVVSQQIVRLMILGGDVDDVRIDEVKTSYRESAKNPDHAARMTKYIIRHGEFFPKPVEVYNAASFTLREEDMPQPDKSCRTCDGTGREPIAVLYTSHKRPGGSTYTSKDVILNLDHARELAKKVDGQTQEVYLNCSRPCTKCRYGRALAEADRNSKPATKKPAVAVGKISAGEVKTLMNGDS